MRRGFTLIEVVVVLAILATLCGLLAPAFFAARDAATTQQKAPAADSGPPSTMYLYTVQHDGHWWIIERAARHFEHHPDCPCRSRKPEVE